MIQSFIRMIESLSYKVEGEQKKERESEVWQVSNLILPRKDVVLIAKTMVNPSWHISPLTYLLC